MSTLGPITRAWTVKVYRDDSTTPIVYSDVKHLFWTADNSVLVIAQYTDGPGQEAHHYIHWPRERVCWYRLERAAASAEKRPRRPRGIAPSCRGRSRPAGRRSSRKAGARLPAHAGDFQIRRARFCTEAVTHSQPSKGAV